ncbi:MAG TPA: alpha/beta family hydrolase [Bryobacteraceae bacterium]|nr:alpha/beta family hydrolase [Bryobacteraceae bacterium]
MSRRIESLFINGPAGKLEALLEEPEDQDPRHAVLVCHPHPQHGGTMHNKVVYRIARALRRAGAVVLRFNFRGVNLSQGEYGHGVGELEDARAALALLRSRYPDLPFSLAGFSFGSRIILKLGCEIGDAKRLIAVGFPANLSDSQAIGQCTVPKTLIVSRIDQFCAVPAMETYFAALPEPKELIWIDAADHFFGGALDEFEETIYRVGAAAFAG